MKLIYDESKTKSVVENYFKIHEGIDASLEIVCGVETIPALGRSVAWHQVPTISFLLRGSIEVEGEMRLFEKEIEKQAVKNAFTTMLMNSGERVRSVSINYDEEGFSNITADVVEKVMAKNKYGNK